LSQPTSEQLIGLNRPSAGPTLAGANLDRLPGLIDRRPTRTTTLLEWLTGHPLVPSAVGIMAGISVDARMALPFYLLVLLFILAAGAIFQFRRADGLRHLAIGIAAFALGALLHDLSFRRWPQDHIVRYSDRHPIPIRLMTTVVSPPRIQSADDGNTNRFSQLPRSRMMVEAETLEGVAGDIPAERIGLC